MKAELLRPRLDGVPNMTFAQAEKITALILEHGFRDILELGFYHGVSTCYMAAALDELGRGKITTIDKEFVRNVRPGIAQLLEEFGLRRYVDVIFEPTSYTWRLMKLIEANQEPIFDFCYLDGAHNWDTDGFAFFLVDRLLRPGGLILFDDLSWTYAASPSMKDSMTVQKMPVEEKTTPQIRKVFELLVMRHPGYTNFSEQDDWGFAWKRA